MWRRLFIFKAVPGIIINPKYGRIDFRRDDLPVDMLQDLYENDFPYLELTPAGKQELYGIMDGVHYNEPSGEPVGPSGSGDPMEIREIEPVFPEVDHDLDKEPDAKRKKSPSRKKRKVV